MRLALSKMYAPFDIDTNGLILIVMDDSKDIPDSDAISVAQQLKQNIGKPQYIHMEKS